MSAPNLEEIIEAGVEAALEDVYVAEPAIITSSSPGSHTVSAQPINAHHHVDEDQEIQAVAPAIIPQIPVYYPGSGGNRITFPIKSGSLALLVHTTGSNEAWLHSDGSKVVDPQDRRRHDYTDAVAFPGLMTTSGAGAGGSAKVSDTALVIHTDDKILLGSDEGTHPVARNIDVINGIKGVLTDATVLAAIETYKTAIATGIPPVATAKAALETAIDNHFVADPIGSDVVEAK